MKRKDLAVALGISPSLVSRFAGRGMPTHDIELARRWRDRHLDPARRKEHRAQLPPSFDALVARAERAGARALAALGGPTWPNASDDCRAALRAVPTIARPAVRLPVPVFDALCAEVIAAVEADRTDADRQRDAEVFADDAEADEMGAFWYSVAAGELRIGQGGGRR